MNKKYWRFIWLMISGIGLGVFLVGIKNLNQTEYGFFHPYMTFGLLYIYIGYNERGKHLK